MASDFMCPWWAQNNKAYSLRLSLSRLPPSLAMFKQLTDEPIKSEREGTWLGEGVGMDHGKGAGMAEPAPVGHAGDAGPIKPGGTGSETPPLRPYLDLESCYV
jgi:hypothetical protein